MKKDTISHSSIERRTHGVLYVLLGVTAVVYVAFLLSSPGALFSGNNELTAPMLTDGLLALMAVLLALALAAVGVALWLSAGLRKGATAASPYAPTRHLGLMVTLGVTACVAVALLCGSSEPMLINGMRFADTFWLRAADMFVGGSLLLIVAAVAVVVFGYTRYYRKTRP